ncbi:MAG: hypothetical protein GDA38_16355 [Hormoscilla sp. SP12CHS1]|nr:hypothetical protein [Hormoscilla sp. SP12CHS1]
MSPQRSVIHQVLPLAEPVRTIPSELGSLSKLQLLYLHDNSLSGTIPSELGSLSKLLELYLSSNSLNGTIPEI